ncbi:cytochrome P450 [Porphyrobacter sp. HT-58-2]|uniref:cytochrome P450 n=1 Tax=Porphyrobacter sp. HT-58-2 TaxID=2023229 RepID=UPI000CDC0EA4|nr:cytochrome P450 [Porphyrobacter sp. HT-58-2]AUX68316.1 cytochrome P450 [Porphyrobacter sp. HT-58-2]
MQAEKPRTLAEVDLFAPGAQEHWYQAYAILHEQSPVQRLPGEGLTPGTDAFVLTKYEDVRRVVMDWDRFPPTLSLLVAHIQQSGQMPTHIPDIDAMVASIVSLRPDPELWRAHRKELTDPWVGPGCTRHAEMITAHVDDLIAGMLDKARGGEPVDFVADFARPLPQRVMASVLGFPLEDIPRLEQWGNAQVMSYVHGRTHRNILTPEQTKEKFRLLAGMKDYVAEKTREKRARPQDDMVSFLTQVEYQALGRKLTDDEINGVVYAMVIGGLETTQYALAEQAQLLCQRPGMFATLRGNRGAIRTFIEEGVRLRSPTQGLSTRICAHDEVFQGVPVPAGSMLHLRWAAANIDADEFEDPLELKLDRKAATRHLAFSQGPRSCPGSNISRLEQMIAWEKVCDAFSGLAYAAGNDFRHQGGIMLGIYRLMLTLTPTETS